MSEDLRDFFYHQPYHDERHRNTAAFPYSGGHSPSDAHGLQMFDPSYLGFTGFLHGSTDQSSLPAAYGGPTPTSKEEEKPAAVETPATPNSSISSSSTEAAAAEEDSHKSKKEKGSAIDDGDQDNSKKLE